MSHWLEFPTGMSQLKAASEFTFISRYTMN